MSGYTGNNPFDDDNQNPFEEVSIDDGGNQPPPPPKNKPKVPAKPIPPPPKKDDRAQFFDELNSPIEMTWEGIQKKEAELARREEDLDRREQSLYEKEKSLPMPRIPNWPPCKPFIYHNIKEDIPTPEGQRLVKFAYAGWFGLGIGLIWNVFTLTAILFANNSGSAIGGFILSLVFFIVSVPISLLVYRLVYNAARKGKPSLYVLYFIFLALQCVVLIFFAIGWSGWGGGGFFVMIEQFQDDQLVLGMFALVCTIVWVAMAAWHIYLFFPARIEYRKAGGLVQAKQEFSEEASKQMAEHPELVAEGAKFAASSQK